MSSASDDRVLDDSHPATGDEDMNAVNLEDLDDSVSSSNDGDREDGQGQEGVVDDQRRSKTILAISTYGALF